MSLVIVKAEPAGYDMRYTVERINDTATTPRQYRVLVSGNNKAYCTGPKCRISACIHTKYVLAKVGK